MSSSVWGRSRHNAKTAHQPTAKQPNKRHGDRNADIERLESGPFRLAVFISKFFAFFLLWILGHWRGHISLPRSDWNQIGIRFGTKLLISESQDEHLVRDSRKTEPLADCVIMLVSVYCSSQIKSWTIERLFKCTVNSISLYIAIGSECSHCDVTHWFVEFGLEASSLSFLASPSCFFGTRNVRRRFHILLIWANKCY